MRKLFILRPEPGSIATAERARKLDLEPVAVPLFRVEAVEWTVPDPSGFDALLLTSANAVREAGNGLERLLTLPAHCVGEATAEAARDVGIEVASVGEGGVDDLLARISPGQRLLHLAGEHRRYAEHGGHVVTSITVYRSSAVPMSGLSAMLRGHVAAVHSPRAAERLCELVGEAERAAVRVAAISPAAAEATGSGWEHVEAAKSPNDDALLSLAARLCKDCDPT